MENKKRIGILGGGQLGRMLIQSAQNFNVSLSVMDNDNDCPCYEVNRNFFRGDITNFDDVVEFGKNCDIMTIEIERVNTEALKVLENSGVEVYPSPYIIELIQDKSKQKNFYKENEIPTSDFKIVNNRKEIYENINLIPCVNKISVGGYDGKGVQILRDEKDIEKAFDSHGILEKLVDIEKEISIIVCRNSKGQIECYPPVEMVFHKEANLVEYLVSPSEIDEYQKIKAQEICKKIVEKLNFIGILAIEMFIDGKGEILVNEIAPRPHNSGHQTIEGNYTSQYEQLVRILLGYPLGNTEIVKPSIMINLLGEENNFGEVYLEGMTEVMSIKGLNFHFYGKKITSPYRKMGHITILGDDINELKEKADWVKSKIKVLGKDKN